MLNRAILMGRLVADPELRQTPNGVSVCSFRIAVDRNYSSRGGERQADFIDIVAWRQSAEFVSKYFNKGKMIIVEGSIQTRSYEDKNGNKRTAVEVVADNVQFGESKSASSSSQSYSAPAPIQAPPEPAVSYASGDVGDFSEMAADSDDLPF
ncbi:single-stranded DNA-binding protein [Anaerotruncus rubiinfantis]|uniref:single-stranded DNA-binding protein n=1 Tax=Anaerotruncus rubiinfantis TaxID=1720200 RepID=UPI0034A23AB7